MDVVSHGSRDLTKLLKAVPLLVVAVLALALVASASATITNVVVHPSGTGWTQDDTRVGGAVGWTTAFGAPAGFGSGSLELSTDGTTAAKAGLYNHSVLGTPLSQVTALSYATFQQAASFAGADASYQLQIDVDGTLGDGLGFTTLVYEPYNGSPANGTVTPQTWQTWDVAAGQFWSSRTTVDGGHGFLTAGSGGAPFYTLADVKAMYPNAVVVGIAANIGSNNPSWDVGVDALRFNDTVYNFEPGTGCDTSTTGTTITLLADCTETSSFTVPSGFTFDGASHTLTAADPSSTAAFVGAAVQNTTGGEMTVTHLTVRGASNIVDCNEFTGIQFLDGGGSVTYTTVDNMLRGGYTGCQNGLGIRVYNSTTAPKTLTVDHATVTKYNKNGITVSGPVAATITNNTVTGAGPLGLGFAAQNGIQISYGATAQLVGNTVTLNNYTPSKVTACGLLIYKAGGVSGATKNGISYVKADNAITNNETDICNFGKGGGFSPTP